MRKVITEKDLSKELVTFLKKHRVLPQFMENFNKKESTTWRNAQERGTITFILIKAPIMNGFHWTATDQGDDFWQEINNKWEELNTIEVAGGWDLKPSSPTRFRIGCKTFSKGSLEKVVEFVKDKTKTELSINTPDRRHLHTIVKGPNGNTLWEEAIDENEYMLDSRYVFTLDDINKILKFFKMKQIRK